MQKRKILSEGPSDYGADENKHTRHLDGPSLFPLELLANLSVWTFSMYMGFLQFFIYFSLWKTVHSLRMHFKLSLTLINVNVNVGANGINGETERAV
jgi:hypothetical protein